MDVFFAICFEKIFHRIELKRLDDAMARKLIEFWRLLNIFFRTHWRASPRCRRGVLYPA